MDNESSDPYMISQSIIIIKLYKKLVMKIKEPDLQSIIGSLYGPKLKKFKNIKTAYSIFTAYKNVETDHVEYFYLLKTEAKHHLSEESISSALKKYHPFISKVDFLLIDKNFDHSYYLIKTNHYLISMHQLIILQKDCQQVMQKQYILKTIQFLIQIYQTIKKPLFPELTPNSIGINELGKLQICDYQFYFKKNFEMRSLTQNICSCINPMIKASPFKSSPRVLSLEDEYQRLKEDYGQSFAKLIKILVLDPMDDMEKEGVFDGQGKQVSIKKIQDALQQYFKTVEVDGNTTLNQTFQEDYKHQNPSKKFRQSDLISRDSIKEPFLFKDELKKNKRKRVIKISAFVMMFLLVAIGALIFFFYFSKQTNCDVGSFKPIGSNQCLSCSQGCLRCENQLKNACFSCSGKMYLVLMNQNDTKGSCETTCVGTVLKSNLCLKSKNPNEPKIIQYNLTSQIN